MSVKQPSGLRLFVHQRHSESLDVAVYNLFYTGLSSLWDLLLNKESQNKAGVHGVNSWK